MPKDKAIAIATDKCSREKHSTQSTSPPWSNEKIAINKKQVSSQLLKCCKNTRHGAGGGTLRSNRPLLALRAARPDCFRSPAGQNAPQDRFVSPASSPVRLNQTQRHPTGASVFGAGGGTRTHTVLLPTDFESVTSANSITPANMFKFCTYISLTHFLNGFKRENHIILKI
jgi:hypothetical protein